MAMSKRFEIYCLDMSFQTQLPTLLKLSEDKRSAIVHIDPNRLQVYDEV